MGRKSHQLRPSLYEISKLNMIIFMINTCNTISQGTDYNFLIICVSVELR